MEPAELSEVAENRDVFRDLELLLPAILIRGMRVWKWMNKQPYFSKAAHRQTSDQVSDNISDLAWSHLDVEPAELSEVAENREVFRLP